MAEKREKKEPVSPVAPPEAAGRYAYDGLERVIHEKARLGIMASLSTHPDGLLFNDLKDLCSLTDGNLSRHLQLLQESAFIEVWKGYRKNRPQTLVRLSNVGRKRFLEYIAVLESVVADAATATTKSARAGKAAARAIADGLAPA